MTCDDFDAMNVRVDRGEWLEMSRAERDALRTHYRSCDRCHACIEKKMEEERQRYGDLACRIAVSLGQAIRMQDIQDPEVGT